MFIALQKVTIQKFQRKFDGFRIAIVFIVFVIVSNWFLSLIQNNSLQINK